MGLGSRQSLKISRKSVKCRNLPYPFLRGQPLNYPCKDCGKNVPNNQNAILCSECNYWFHMKCLKMSSSNIKFYLNHPSLDWTCCFCALANLSDSLFPDEMDLTDLTDQTDQRIFERGKLC